MHRKKKFYNFTGVYRTVTPQHRPTFFLFCFPVMLFVLTHQLNLNKERNKWARCLGADALTNECDHPH